MQGATLAFIFIPTVAVVNLLGDPALGPPQCGADAGRACRSRPRGGDRKVPLSDGPSSAFEFKEGAAPLAAIMAGATVPSTH